MAVNPSNLGAVLYADEATFGDTGNTTFDQRLTTIGQPDVSGLTHAKLDLGRTVQFQNETHHAIRGPAGGTVTLNGYLTGHGSTCTGAITATELGTFLGRVIGNINVTADGGSVTTAVDESSFDSTDSTGVDGGLIRVGALGDGGGDGQFVAYATYETNTYTLLTDMPANPSATNQVYAPEHIYPNESATSASVTSMRFRIMSGNDHYDLWGCYPMSVSFSGLSPGQLPQWSVTLGVSYWDNSSGTFPTSTAQDVFSPSPVAAGSFFYQTLATTTRATLGVREFNLNINMNTVPIVGPGSTNAFMSTVGAVRTMCQASFDFVTDAETTGTQAHADLYDTSENAVAWKHVLYTLSVQDGRAVGFYFPKCAIDKDKPKQFDMDGLNRVRSFYKCSSKAVVGDTELQNANFLIGLA